jgi:hypothetical protein
MSGVCLAVDNQGRFLTERNGSWSKPQSLERDALTTVSCGSASFCVALDDTGRALVFNGLSWSAPAPVGRSVGIGGYGPDSLSCPPGPPFCLVGDQVGRVRTFDGTAWSTRQTIAPRIPNRSLALSSYGIAGVSCPSSTFCGAVTQFGAAFVLDGSRWARSVVQLAAEPSRTSSYGRFGSFTGVSCPASGFCVAVDQGGDASLYRSGRWSPLLSIDAISVTRGNQNGLTAVSCATVQFCMAVDDLGQVVTYNGASWSTPRLVDPNLGLSSISCPTVTFCGALDRFGMAVEFNGTSWTTPRSIER